MVLQGAGWQTRGFVVTTLFGTCMSWSFEGSVTLTVLICALSYTGHQRKLFVHTNKWFETVFTFFMDGMAPSTDVTSNSDVWPHPGIQWSCNRIDNNALLGIQSALTTIEVTNNSTLSFTASSTRIAPAATHNQAAVTDPSSPSHTRFRKLFQKLKRALCEFVETHYICNRTGCVGTLFLCL